MLAAFARDSDKAVPVRLRTVIVGLLVHARPARQRCRGRGGSPGAGRGRTAAAYHLPEAPAQASKQAGVGSGGGVGSVTEEERADGAELQVVEVALRVLTDAAQSESQVYISPEGPLWRHFNARMIFADTSGVCKICYRPGRPCPATARHLLLALPFNGHRPCTGPRADSAELSPRSGFWKVSGDPSTSMDLVS